MEVLIRKLIIFFCFSLIIILIEAQVLSAQKSSETQLSLYKAALLLEAQTGQILYKSNSHKKIIPASLVKMMVALITMERLESGELDITDVVSISAFVSRIGGRQVYLKEGEVFKLDELIKAMIVISANDATGAIAEHISGDVDSFVKLMNQRARSLHMENTRFFNPHGLPPINEKVPENETTAYDLGILAQELLKYPKYLEYSSIQLDTFRNGTYQLLSTYRSLLRNYPGLDGLKTGYHQKAGFNIVSTAQQKNFRLVAIVVGSLSLDVRNQAASSLLDIGFKNFKRIQVAKRGIILPKKVSVLNGKKDLLEVQVSQNYFRFLRPSEEKALQTRVNLPDSVTAPIKSGSSIGTIEYLIYGKLLKRLPLIARHGVEDIEISWVDLMSLKRSKQFFERN